MTNIDIIGQHLVEDFIPRGYQSLDNPNYLIQKDDMVAMVSITDLQKKSFSVTWIKVDDTEIGKETKYAGQIVIRAFEK